MHDAAVALVSTALRDPATGIAALLPQVPNRPEGVPLLVPAVVDERDTAWVARGAVPSAREFADGPLLSVFSADELREDQESDASQPWLRIPVVVSYLTREADARIALQTARTVLRAIVRSVRAPWYGAPFGPLAPGTVGMKPHVTVGGIAFRPLEPDDVQVQRSFEPLGDAVIVQDVVLSLRALDPWAWGLA